MLNKKTFRGAPVATLYFFLAMVRRSLQVPPVLWHPVAPVQRKPLQHKAPLRFHRLFSWEKAEPKKRGKRLWVYRWCMICFEILYLYTAKTNVTICNYLHLFTWKRTSWNLSPMYYLLGGDIWSFQNPHQDLTSIFFRFTHIHAAWQARFEGQNFPPKKVLPNEMQLQCDTVDGRNPAPPGM